jgi:hypothetical protein
VEAPVIFTRPHAGQVFVVSMIAAGKLVAPSTPAVDPDCKVHQSHLIASKMPESVGPTKSALLYPVLCLCPHFLIK